MSEEVKIDAKRVQAITNMGQAYDDVDPLVEAARNHVIKECRRYNFLVNSQNKYDYSILKGLFNKMGEENYIEPNFMCELGLNISLGSNVYINHDMVILDCNEVTIGDPRLHRPQGRAVLCQPRRRLGGTGEPPSVRQAHPHKR